jgi:hypothetical protein
MNWISSSRWFWRGLRGQSVTFAALFAFGLLGFSVFHGLRLMLHAMHAPWYLWLILPFVIVSGVARWETQILPDESQRRRWSRWLIFGSIALSIVIATLTPAAGSEENRQTATHSVSK